MIVRDWLIKLSIDLRLHQCWWFSHYRSTDNRYEHCSSIGDCHITKTDSRQNAAAILMTVIKTAAVVTVRKTAAELITVTKIAAELITVTKTAAVLITVRETLSNRGLFFTTSTSALHCSIGSLRCCVYQSHDCWTLVMTNTVHS